MSRKDQAKLSLRLIFSLSLYTAVAFLVLYGSFHTFLVYSRNFSCFLRLYFTLSSYTAVNFLALYGSFHTFLVYSRSFSCPLRLYFTLFSYTAVTPACFLRLYFALSSYTAVASLFSNTNQGLPHRKVSTLSITALFILSFNFNPLQI